MTSRAESALSASRRILTICSGLYLLPFMSCLSFAARLTLYPVHILGVRSPRLHHKLLVREIRATRCLHRPPHLLQRMEGNRDLWERVAGFLSLNIRPIMTDESPKPPKRPLTEGQVVPPPPPSKSPSTGG